MKCPCILATKRQSGGRYLKDKRTPEKYQYEEVVIYKDYVNSGIEAYVNVHAVNGELGEYPKGEYLITIDNVIYTAGFSASLRRGNLGANIEGRESSPFWIKLDLSALQKPIGKDKKDLLH